ncbi:glycosyltransferase family 2 protein [bacterium]|nr:glycosyltransferase family 2 protein [bacterium]
MTKLSIVLPVYNVEKYLKETLNCLVNQTFSDIEIICINDCSKDNSRSILTDFASKDKRVKIIDNEQNSGAAVSRNKGLDIATGEYVLFLDSDDIFERNLAESVIKAADENNSDIVIYNYDTTTGNKKINFKKNKKLIDKKFFSYKDIPDRIFNIIPPNAFSKLYRRKFLQENNLRFQSLKSCNDSYFALASLILAKQISLLDKVLLHYRINATGNISSSRGVHYKNIISVMKSLKSFLEENSVYNEVEKSFIKAFRNHLRYEFKFVSKENKMDFIEFCKSELGNDWKNYEIITKPVIFQKFVMFFN